MGSAALGMVVGATEPQPPSQQLLSQQQLLRCMRARRRSIKLGLQQLLQESQQEAVVVVPQQLEVLLQQLVVAQLLVEAQLLVQQELLSQQLLRWKRAFNRSLRLGLQQLSHSQPQEDEEPQQPDTEALATGAEATGAGLAGAGSAANHAVVTNKNAAFTSVILRWKLSSAEGRRIAGERFLPKKRRPAPSSFDSTPTKPTSS
jgi:hypothetical protein